MEPCTLPYIPENLKTNDREEIHVFSIGEKLFRRCTDKELNNPFLEISLFDISVNREGTEPNILSQPSDVLYNIRPDLFPQEKYTLKICTLEIQELTDTNHYEKIFTEEMNIEANVIETLTVLIQLRHKAEPCMYPHCAFQFYFNDVEVTSENYKATFGKSGSARSKLRTKCKQELAKMIIKEAVRINWQEDIINQG